MVPQSGENSADTSRYSFVKLSATAGEGVTATLTSVAFPPVWEMFGPGFDVFANIYGDSRSDQAHGSGTVNSFTLGEVGGQVTIAVGATTVDSAGGAFTILLGRTPAPAPPAMARTWSLDQLGSMARK